MKECPYCGEKYTNAGLKIHIAKKHKDAAESTPSPKSEVEVALDELTAKLQEPPVDEVSPKDPDEQGEAPQAEVEPVYKETTSAKATKSRYMRVKKHQSGNPAGPPEKDPEDILEIVTKFPVLIAMFAIIYKLVTDWRFFVKWTETDIAELYFFVFSNPSNPVSIIILVVTVLAVVLVAFLVHRLFWRLFFKDLQLRYIKRDDQGELRAVGTSKEGRIFLTIGAGFWDGIYRRITKKPRPKVITIYFKTRGLINPFKVLASCDKGYIRRTDLLGTPRFVTDGLFKRTLIATHRRRDTENHSTIYWFEDSYYDSKDFDVSWYAETHLKEIKEGLRKVSKACLMDSSVQKDQMKNVISWMPSEEIAEHKKVWELKKKLMKPEEQR